MAPRARTPQDRARRYFELGFEQLGEVEDRDLVNRALGYLEARISHIELSLRRAENGAPDVVTDEDLRAAEAQSEIDEGDVEPVPRESASDIIGAA